MAPVAAAGLVMIAAALVMAMAVGTLGGTIAGLLRGELVWGALASAAAHLAISAWSSPMKMGFVGLLPMMVSYLAAALTIRWLRRRLGLHPAAAAPAGLAAGLGAGYLYAWPMRRGSFILLEEATGWIAVVLVLGLGGMMIRSRMRARAAARP